MLPSYFVDPLTRADSTAFKLQLVPFDLECQGAVLFFFDLRDELARLVLGRHDPHRTDHRGKNQKRRYPDHGCQPPARTSSGAAVRSATRMIALRERGLS